MVFQQKLCRLEGSGMIYLKMKRKKTVTKKTSQKKILFGFNGVIKSIRDKQNLEEFNTAISKLK